MRQKTIVVFGASGAIGQEVVKTLLIEGHQVVAITNHHQLELENPQLKIVSCDLLSEHQRIAMLDEVVTGKQSLDGVVFAADPTDKEVFLQDESVRGQGLEQLLSFHGSITIDVITPIIPLLKRGNNPNIIFIGSLAGIKNVGLSPSYTLAKSLTRGLVESWSSKLGEFDIKVNSIDPGLLDAGKGEFVPQKQREGYLKHCSLRRLGKPLEVACIASWFVLNNSYVTGQSILLDGGL
jgi:3-oxoacyl-[acyl-carrier protein] reductase